MRNAIAALLFVALAGCGSKSAGEVEQSRDQPEKVEPTAATAVSDAMDMLEHIAAAIEPGASCADKGAALRAWVDASQAEMTDVSGKLRAFAEPDISRQVDSQMKARPRVQAMFKTARECSSDEAFAGAWAEASSVFEAK
jgi:hypothetical protein